MWANGVNGRRPGTVVHRPVTGGSAPVSTMTEQGGNVLGRESKREVFPEN